MVVFCRVRRLLPEALVKVAVRRVAGVARERKLMFEVESKVSNVAKGENVLTFER